MIVLSVGERRKIAALTGLLGALEKIDRARLGIPEGEDLTKELFRDNIATMGGE